MTPFYRKRRLHCRPPARFGTIGSGGSRRPADKTPQTSARRFLENTRLFALTESLGGVESLIEHPALTTHDGIPPDQRAAPGIGDTLARSPVGVEDVEDLHADLAFALGANLTGP